MASLIAAFAVGGYGNLLSAQEVARVASELELPDGPGMGRGGSQVPRAVALGGIAGTVEDLHGKPVIGAKVSLAGESKSDAIETKADGAFSFADLVPGKYTVTISAAGLETVELIDVNVPAGAVFELRQLEMLVPSSSTSIEVISSRDEIALEQVRDEEKQRVLGILPNFYTSYVWNAAPLPAKLKFRLALRSALDPFAFISAAGVAGVEQAHNTFPGYGDGPEGYAKRYGAAYADTLMGRLIGAAILPTVFHQDPRYFYQGSGSVGSRILHAVKSAVICRGDNGKWQPNYSHVLGNFASAGIANIYRAEEDRNASLTLRNGLIITGSNAISNVVRELISRKLTPKVPAYATGKP